MRNLAKLDSWHSDWKDLRVAVFGLGVSGFSVADTLQELGAKVLVIADKSGTEYLDLLDVIGASHSVGVDWESNLRILTEFTPELVITSPGFRPDSKEIQFAISSGLEIWTDIDLAWRLRDKVGKPADWICITGTNGKTTTTQLTTHILETAGLRAVSCGNIGTPILDCVRDEIGYDVLVVELSSFQLHYLGTIEPFAAAVLNVDLDHLDWHGSLEAYKAAKGKVYANVENACVYNLADGVTKTLVEDADVQEGARAIGFGLGFPTSGNLGFTEDILVDNAFSPNRKAKEIEALATGEEISQIGVITKHLLQNIAAAAALTRAYGVSAESVADAVATFKLDGHRIELVAKKNDIAWIDDSKATNPHAAAASLDSFDSVVWIVGGLLKGVDIAPLVERFASRLKAAIVIGVERTPVVEALRLHAPKVPVIEIENSDSVMSNAVSAAAKMASPGDTVLLAPSSASMDQFKDYADRGRQFADAVKAII
jgi:UDP-N-acetylmuramoylalanine--D-glutamate ligase